MLFNFGFYSSLLLIFFTQGIVYSFLLFIKAIRTENKSNYWLSLFIFLCSLFIAPWMLGFGGWYDNQPYRDILFYIPFQHLFFLGPIIFFYTQSLLNPVFKLSTKDYLHLLPGMIYLIILLSFWIYDTFIFKGYYFYESQTDKDFDSWYQYSGFISMTIYLGLSLRYYYKYKKLIVQVASNADDLLFKWIRNYLLAFLAMICIRLLFAILSNFFPELESYKGTWWFFLMFSIILYYITITGYSNAVISKIAFKLSVLNNQPIYLLHTTKVVEETIIDIEHEIFQDEINPEIEHWKSKIETIIKKERLYRNSELTLTELAKKLETNASVISKTINQGFQMNFNDCINNYRVEAVKNCLANGEHKKSTLLGIAYDCGFNSKATFNRSFKKNTGKTPKEFIETI